MRAAARLVLCVNTDFIDLYRQTESCPSRTALFSSGGEPHARFIRPDVHPVRPGPSRRKAQRGAVSGLCARGTHGIPVSRRIFRSRCRRRGGGALLSRHSQRSAAPLQIRRQTAVCCMVRREMAAVLAAQLDRWQPTCITYLPLGFLRARERGYNQAELLARPIAQSLSMPCVSALRKRPFTARQSVQQDAAARRKNAAGSLLPGRIPLAGERVVVIDDIITTGSTAADAAHVLRSMGAACVFVLAAAKAVN
ncbi:ComF family protein [Butyricicoccus sp. AM29-23AC]|nr:ComF family protein [Butyricicoccus sp. AM29-23AC]